MDSNFVKGTCLDMCPEAERLMRQKERLVHPLEKLGWAEGTKKPLTNKGKMIKSFSRSAAGKNLLHPDNLRPPEVLRKTVNYLLEEVLQNEEMPRHVTYEFIMDRLRSVRQDMVIQNLPARQSICIYQKIVKFYAYSAYSLCSEPVRNFDPHMNNMHLQECLKRLLSMFDESNDPYLYGSTRPFFEALYVVLNLGSVTALTRALNLPEVLKNTDVKLAVLLSRNYIRNNFVKVCRLVGLFSLLLQCVVVLQLPEIRRRALRAMSAAYNSKQFHFPLEMLRKILLYDKIEDVRQDLLYYGLKCRDTEVQFVKAHFNQSKRAVQAQHLQFIDKAIDANTLAAIILNEKQLCI